MLVIIAACIGIALDTLAVWLSACFAVFDELPNGLLILIQSVS